MRLWRCSEEFQEPVYRGAVREVVFGEGGGGLPDSCELECWKDEVLGLKEEACSSSKFLP